MSAEDPTAELDELFEAIEADRVQDQKAIDFFDKYDSIARSILQSVSEMIANGHDAPTIAQERALRNIYEGACRFLGREPEGSGLGYGAYQRPHDPDEVEWHELRYLASLNPLREEREAESRVRRRTVYEDHISSEEWAALREEALRRAGYKCSQCGAKGKLQVHHETYRRFGGAELQRDLRVLCDSCHRGRHDYREEYLKRLRRPGASDGAAG